jgi:hypothetical protein
MSQSNLSPIVHRPVIHAGYCLKRRHSLHTAISVTSVNPQEGASVELAEPRHNSRPYQGHRSAAHDSQPRYNSRGIPLIVQSSGLPETCNDLGTGDRSLPV